jgi:predicted dehydrogenase
MAARIVFTLGSLLPICSAGQLDAPSCAVFAKKTDVMRLPRVHVIGAGAMGARHARVFAAAGARVTVEDTVSSRALDVAGRVPGVVVESFAALAAKNEVHLVVVATPTPTHERVTRAALAGGGHVLVEKPLASTLRAAQVVVEQAVIAERTVLVGMSERFHPVVRALRTQLAERAPAGVSIRAFGSRRFGPGSATQPALLNLGVHDVDLALHLSAAELLLESARAVGADGAHLLLGGGAYSLACGAAPARERRLVVELTSGEVFRADLLAAELVLERPGAPPQTLPLPTGEPLLLQAKAVLAALGNGSVESDGGESAAVALAEDGLRVLRIVEEAQAAMSRGAVNPRPSASYLAASDPTSAAEKL